MGNDGGSIAKRDDLVKHPKKIEKVNQSDLDENRWFKCTLLQDELVNPIVVDDYGNLFNKANVIQALLGGTLSANASLSHIRSMKSVYPVNFSENPAALKKNSSTTTRVSPWYCPVSTVEIKGHQQKFIALKSCGHVFSEKAVKEVKEDKHCLLCTKPYHPSDIILLNPSPEELVEIKQRLKEEKEKEKQSKSLKEKKTKKEKSDKSSKESKDSDKSVTTTTTSTTNTSSSSSSSSSGSKKRQSTDDNLNDATSFTKKTLDQVKELTNKKMKSDAFSSIFKK